MPSNANYTEFDNQVIRFLRNDMSQEEADRFLASLQEDPTLKERASFIAHVAKSIRQEQNRRDIKAVETTANLDKAQYESLVPTDEYLAEFDQKVLNYIRNRMPKEEVKDFEALIRNNSYLKDRAAVIAQAVKAATISKDIATVKAVASMDKEEFSKEAEKTPEKPDDSQTTPWDEQMRASIAANIGGSKVTVRAKAKPQREDVYEENDFFDEYDNEDDVCYDTTFVSYSKTSAFNGASSSEAKSSEDVQAKKPSATSDNKPKSRRRLWIIRHSKVLVAAASIVLIVGIFLKPCLNFYADRVYVPQALEEFAPYSSSDILDVNFKGDVDEAEIQGLAALFDNVSEKKHIPQTIKELKEAYKESEDYYSTYSVFRYEIAWNLALAYLMNNQRKEAIHILDQLIKENEGRYTPAIELKKKITILGS